MRERNTAGRLGFIKDSDGVYRKGNFIFKDNKIIRESNIVPIDDIKEIADNYTTASECIRAILAYPALIGEKPRTTDVYVEKSEKGYRMATKFSKNTVAIVTSARNVIEVRTKDITDQDDIKVLAPTDGKADAKEIKTFSSSKAKDIETITKEELKESQETNSSFWNSINNTFNVGDTLDSSAGKVELLDANKDADYILVKRTQGYQPFVAAWAPEFSNNKISWGQGHYFDTEEAARKFFEEKRLNESALTESTKFYNTEEPDCYLELNNGRVITNSVGTVIDKDVYGLVKNGDTVYVVTSSNEPGVIEAYSVDFGFPFEFKA